MGVVNFSTFIFSWDFIACCDVTFSCPPCKEVGRLKEELGKCHRELELALSDKEKEILASKK